MALFCVRPGSDRANELGRYINVAKISSTPPSRAASIRDPIGSLVINRSFPSAFNVRQLPRKQQAFLSDKFAARVEWTKSPTSGDARVRPVLKELLDTLATRGICLDLDPGIASWTLIEAQNNSATPRESEALRIKPDELVCRVSRLLINNEITLARETLAIRYGDSGLFPLLFTRSAELSDNLQMQISRATEHVTTINLDSGEASDLQVQYGTAGLSIFRIYFTAEGVPAALSTIVAVGGRCCMPQTLGSNAVACHV